MQSTVKTLILLIRLSLLKVFCVSNDVDENGSHYIQIFNKYGVRSMEIKIKSKLGYEDKISTSMAFTLNMPRRSTVPYEDRVEVVKKFMQHFKTKEYPSYTSTIWKDMSVALEGRWTPHSVYINVREDRGGFVAAAREAMGIVTDIDMPQSQQSDVTDTLSSDSEESTKTSEKPKKRKKNNKEDPNKRKKNNEGDPEKRRKDNREIKTTEFELFLTEDEWNAIKPDGTVLYGDRTKEIFQPRVWTNVITIAFWNQHKTNCAFVYKRANVKRSPDDQSYIIDIFGKCKSAACGNTFQGHGEKNHDTKGLIIRVNTRDTRFENHDDVKRPFNGQRRKQAAEQMIREGCAMWKRREARQIMEYGDLEPAFLPNADVMRQAKSERIHANLGVTPDDSRDLIRTIENISVQPTYARLIHAVGSMPFYTFYSTAAQLDVYKKYLKVNRAKSMICVDATGSIVKRLDRPGNTKSGHVFLYSIVINFERTTQAVHQMLSEKHDTEFIEYWLKQWLRRGASKPKEAVSDYSRALISALCLAFNNMTIKAYLNVCFAIIEDNRGIVEPPPTVIRIDVAHLIHMICRWPCFSKANQSCFKDFFIRCVALMVECETLTDLEKIFTLTCAVGLQTHEDAILELPYAKTAKIARKKLESYIAHRGITEKLEKHQPRLDVDYTVGPFESEDSDSNRKFDDDTNTLDDNTTVGCRLVQWVTERNEKAGKSIHKGSDPNAFYLPGFIDRLYKLAKEFPLWTGVAMPCGSPHATSSYVESYFNDVKNRVFSTGITIPTRVDIFIKHLALNIIGESLLFYSKLTIVQIRQAEIENAKQDETELTDSTLAKTEQKKTKLQETENREISEPQPVEILSTCGRMDIHDSNCVYMGEESFLNNTDSLDDFDVQTRNEPELQTETNKNVEPDRDHTSSPYKDINVTELECAAEKGSLFNNARSFNDSDLMAVEDWRGKATLHSIDNFGDASTPRVKSTTMESERGVITSSLHKDIYFDDVECAIEEVSSVNVSSLNDSDIRIEDWVDKALHRNELVDVWTLQDKKKIEPKHTKTSASCETTDIGERKCATEETLVLNAVEDLNNSNLIATVERFEDHVDPCLDHSYSLLHSSSNSKKLLPKSVALELNNDDELKGSAPFDETACVFENDANYTNEDAALDENENIVSFSMAKENSAVEIVKSQVAKTSKYFRCYPEIRVKNMLTVKRKTPHLLPNGGMCRRGIEINGETVFIRNTCPFDALIHILMTIGIDDLQYASFLEKSENRTLKFVSDLINNGVIDEVLRERVNIQHFYKKSIAHETKTRVLSYSIDAWDSARHILDCTLESEPSVRNYDECSHCDGRTYSDVTIAPNHNVISRRGFSCLASAIAFKPIVYGVSCHEECPGKYTLFRELNLHMFVELDVRKEIPIRLNNPKNESENKKRLYRLSKKGLKCKLEEMPLSLEFEVRDREKRNFKKTVKYRLAGLVGFSSGHFTAYSRRCCGTWQVYDDMATSITTSTASKEIEPHVAVYVRS